jgi:hypothetical protein
MYLTATGTGSMQHDFASASDPFEQDWATVRVTLQAIGALMVRRGTSVSEADAFLSATAEAMGVRCGALSRLIVDALNARGSDGASDADVA